jgi:hypothetical protein
MRCSVTTQNNTVWIIRNLTVLYLLKVNLKNYAVDVTCENYGDRVTHS